MQSTLLLLVKVGLLALLWFFVWSTLRALKKDADAAAGYVTPVASAPADPGQPAAPTPPPPAPSHRSQHRAPTGLTILNGPLAGTVVDLSPYTELTIGRDSTASIQLADDYASGSHARLVRRGNDWFVEDLESRNGTWIGQNRIDLPEKLYPGLDIRIGQTLIRMHV